MSDEQKIIILAGPNGAGKTTLAREFLPNEANCPDFLNADLIAAGLSPFNPDAAAIRAGRLMLEEIEMRVAKRRSFAIETTLSGRCYAKKIPVWQSLGYQVKLIFLSLPNADMAVARVAARVSQGGHNIPEDVIRRRFKAGLENLEQVFKELVDAWMLHDNSKGKLEILAWEPPTDLDLIGASHALKRSAANALKIARKTHTPCYLYKDGNVVDVAAPRGKVQRD